MIFRLRTDLARIRRWPDGSVLFSRTSGDTVFFDALSSEVLSRVGERSYSLEDLTLELERKFTLSGDEGMGPYLQSLLEKLRSMALLHEEES